MRKRAEHGPEPSGVGSARIQPENSLDHDDEDLPDDEALDRKLGDADLLFELQLTGYSPDKWNPVANEFARYGYNVITGWLRTGAIFDQVARATGTQLKRPDDRLDDDAVATLTADTVVAALDAFLNEVLKKYKWDPTGGASLKTFFIGQCKFQFRNVYKKWYRAEHRLRRLRLVPDARLLEDASTQPDSPAAGIIRYEDATAALQALSTDKARRALALFSLGYSHAEIAIEIGAADEKSVENLIGHQRRRLNRQPSLGERAV